jgi:hypothetical protein
LQTARSTKCLRLMQLATGLLLTTPREADQHCPRECCGLADCSKLATSYTGEAGARKLYCSDYKVYKANNIDGRRVRSGLVLTFRLLLGGHPPAVVADSLLRLADSALARWPSGERLAAVTVTTADGSAADAFTFGDSGALIAPAAIEAAEGQVQELSLYLELLGNGEVSINSVNGRFAVSTAQLPRRCMVLCQ